MTHLCMNSPPLSRNRYGEARTGPVADEGPNSIDVLHQLIVAFDGSGRDRMLSDEAGCDAAAQGKRG